MAFVNELDLDWCLKVNALKYYYFTQVRHNFKTLHQLFPQHSSLQDSCTEKSQCLVKSPQNDIKGYYLQVSRQNGSKFKEAD